MRGGILIRIEWTDTFFVAVSLLMLLGYIQSPLTEAAEFFPPEARTKEDSLVICSSLSCLEKRRK